MPATAFLDGGPVPADLEFPLVVRPAAAISAGAGTLGSAPGATTCADRAELDRCLAGRGEGEVLMAQPQLRGTNEGLFGLATPAGVRAWSAHRRLRMMNPAGSGSSACESTVPDPELCDQVAEMLAAIGWQGLFMVELMRDESGTPWFIELNGRAWGSMALARAGGLEYPAWAARLALGEDLGELPTSPPVAGRRARHLGRELKHALIVMRGPRSAAVPWPSRTRTLREVFSFRARRPLLQLERPPGRPAAALRRHRRDAAQAQAEERGPVIRAAAHVHTDWSYDGSWGLEALVAELKRRGYGAVLTAEHDRTFDPERWQRYREACAAAAEAVGIPVVAGIEYSDADNVVHVPVWGSTPPSSARAGRATS